jgi:hypothetical protein
MKGMKTRTTTTEIATCKTSTWNLTQAPCWTPKVLLAPPQSLYRPKSCN